MVGGKKGKLIRVLINPHARGSVSHTARKIAKTNNNKKRLSHTARIFFLKKATKENTDADPLKSHFI